MAGATALSAMDEFREKKEQEALSARAQKQGQGNADWPADLPKPDDDDIAYMAELSKKNTGIDFFDKGKKR